jgi:hypothetical protein
MVALGRRGGPAGFGGGSPARLALHRTDHHGRRGCGGRRRDTGVGSTRDRNRDRAQRRPALGGVCRQGDRRSPGKTHCFAVRSVQGALCRRHRSRRPDCRHRASGRHLPGRRRRSGLEWRRRRPDRHDIRPRLCRRRSGQRHRLHVRERRRSARRRRQRFPLSRKRGGRVDGGPGRDWILVSGDARVDRVRCGRGPDFVSADPIDRVGPDCETVRYPD